MDCRTIWKHIFPYRHLTTCCPSPAHTCEEVYDSLLTSLQTWFSAEPLNAVNFSLWSVAMMVAIMQNISVDFGAKSVLFQLASQDIRELLLESTVAQLHFLSQRLRTT